MGDKSVETLGSKIRFLNVLVISTPPPPLPPKTVLIFFYFFDCTDHSAYTTLNWGPGGIRELALDANKIEQMLKRECPLRPSHIENIWHMMKIKIFHILPRDTLG